MVHKLQLWLVALLIGLSFSARAQQFTLSGFITSDQSGEALIAANVKVLKYPQAHTTNDYGFFSISLPGGKYAIEVSAVGYKRYEQTLVLAGDSSLSIVMEELRNELETVQIRAGAVTAATGNAQMGIERLSMKEISLIPVLLGERDIIKSLQLLPGVKNGGEGNGGFFVRGGGADQNKILLDEVPVYNATHLLGFFSTFNSDAVKSVSLYKSNIPAQYGGGLSSVLDVKMNEGNNQHFGVNGGISLIAARINVEGPIQKNKSSFLFSARRTYADRFLKYSADSTVKNTSLYFYDFNAKANYIIDQKNRLYISGYLGKDVLKSLNINGLAWGNIAGVLRWNHVFNNKLFSNSSVIYSNYHYDVDTENNGVRLGIYSQIKDWNFKQDFQWFLGDKSKISFGLNSIYHVIKPGEVQSKPEVNGVSAQKLEDRYSLENALYLSHNWRFSERLQFDYGLRFSGFSILGKGDYYRINNGVVTDTMRYARGEFAHTYLQAEPRMAMSFLVNANTSLKASYSRNTQNLHLISNATSLSPTDRWIASTNIIKPELSDQFALGYHRKLINQDVDVSVEGYFKRLQNQIDYKNGADIFTNAPIETLLLFGKGRAYGVEFLVKKQVGRLSGWVGYTLSKTERKIAGVNNDQWYNAQQDRTHDVSVVMTYRLSRLWSTALTWVYATGNAVTFPNGKYNVGNQNYFYFASRNADRMPDYHRLDLGATCSLQRTDRFSSELHFSIYNAYGRRNAYQIEFKSSEVNPGSVEVVQTTLFRFVPSIAYNFKF